MTKIIKKNYSTIFYSKPEKTQIDSFLYKVGFTKSEDSKNSINEIIALDSNRIITFPSVLRNNGEQNLYIDIFEDGVYQQRLTSSLVKKHYDFHNVEREIFTINNKIFVLEKDIAKVHLYSY